MKKNLLRVIAALSSILTLLQATSLSAANPKPKSADPKPQVIIIKEEKKKEEKKPDELKSFGTSLLGGFIGGTLGGGIAKPRETKKAVTAKLSDRERKLIEEIARLEDDTSANEREMIRIKRKIVAYETEVKVLKENNRDLQEDLEKTRLKKKTYKKLAQEKRDEVEKLEAEIKQLKNEESPASQDK